MNSSFRVRSEQSSAKNGPSIGELESHIGFWLRYVSNHVSSQFALLIEQEGVSISEWVALRQLFHSAESATSDLIDALGMTKGAVSKVISRLEEKQLVRRIASTNDKREQAIELTTSGQAIVPKLATLADKNDITFFGHLSETERNELIKTLKEIVAKHQLKELPIN